jgi:hypothetical protein
VAVQQHAEVLVRLGDPLAAGQRFGGQLADQAGGRSLGRDGKLLGGGGGKGVVGEPGHVGTSQPAGCGQVRKQALRPAARISAGVT